MSFLKRANFIYVVLVVTLVTMSLITGYIYVLSGKSQVLKPYELKAASIFSKIQKNTDTSNTSKFFDELKLAGLKGQNVSGQVVVRTDRTDTKVNIEIADVKKDGNSTIPEDNFLVGLETFIEVEYKSDPASNGIGFYPDPVVFNPAPHELKRFTNQPFVVRINIPDDCESGLYEGEIKAEFNERERLSIPLKLYVYDRRFPKKRYLKNYRRG